MIPDNNSHHEYETVFLLQSDCNSADEEEKVRRWPWCFLSNYVVFFLKNFVLSAQKWATLWDYSLFIFFQQCACDSSVISQHEASSESARKKLIFAAILSVVFMVKCLNQSQDSD